MMKKINADRLITIIFMLYIIVYIAVWGGIYFINNANIMMTILMIEFYLVVISLLCIPYIKEKSLKFKVLLIVLLYSLKYLLLIIRYN